MIILKNFDNIEEAEIMRDKFKKLGCDVKMTATWSRSERRNIITVKAFCKN